MADWEIRKVDGSEPLQEFEELQDEVWPGSHVDIVPAHMLLAAIHNGGLLLGAYHNNQLIGISFGFPGINNDKQGMLLKFCSHFLGVHPNWRDAGVGFSLKCAQRQFVIEQRIDLVTWTYDPLISRNAYLNLSRLGTVCKTYLRSEYGPMRDKLNSGLESDRFQVDWWVNSARVEDRLKCKMENRLHLSDLLSMGIEILKMKYRRQPANNEAKYDQPMLAIEIPSEFQALKETDLLLAKDWRMITRVIFEKAFARGYLVTDFIFDQGQCFYILTNQT
jgi:predicted GNAT superfamily acetyltransferase